MFTCQPVEEDYVRQNNREEVFTPLEFGLAIHAIQNSINRNPLYTYKGKLTERGQDLQGFLDKANILADTHRTMHGTPLIPGIVETESGGWDDVGGPVQGQQHQPGGNKQGKQNPGNKQL